MSVDELCEQFSRKKTKLTVKFLDGEKDMILFEGEASALEFLGKLLIAQSTASDCGFEIAPNSAGRALFSTDSTLGIYIHRIPCAHKER